MADYGNSGYAQVGGSTDRVAKDSAFLDPTGNYANAMSIFKSMFTDANGSFNPEAAMNAFLGQTGGLTNAVAGATGPVSQMLSAQAARNAKLGGEAALASMPGGVNSGAGQYAFGDAYSKAFSDAAIQTQQAQLGLLSPLLQQNLGSQYDLMKQGMASYGQMASNQGEFYVPTYEKKKSFWDYLTDAAGLATSAAGAFGVPTIGGKSTTSKIKE